jgi:polyribonucleotide nucleotidyltransferase
MKEITVEREIAGRKLVLKTGKIAKQTSGTVIVQCGDSIVLCAAVGGGVRDGIDFFPLMCEYQERFYASGKIPGSFQRREGRPSTRETLTSRLIDRPIRPNFPKGYFNEVQITCQVLSYDSENDPAILAMIGASAALGISNIPFRAVLGAVKMGIIDGQLVVNPSLAQMKNSDLDLIVSGSKDSIMMVESGAKEISELQAIEALTKAQEIIAEVVALEEELIAKAGQEKDEFIVVEEANAFLDAMKAKHLDALVKAFRVSDKKLRGKSVRTLKDSLAVELLAGIPEDELYAAKGNFVKAFDEFKTVAMREIIFSGTRCDGRSLTQVRPITIETGILPRAHGSALFTRGETQAIVTATLGTLKDGMLVDDLNERRIDNFMLHYNFPPYSVGESGPNRGVGRREVGHGMLAQRALTSTLPEEKSFPYTLRIVSEITESNGSSSMASVCGGSLALMDAGVPVAAPVAGIAMGLCQEGDREAILTDILGDEDHYGDMDFKVTGTAKGITALQMDIKIQGLSRATLEKALDQAKEGRLHILGEMAKALSTPRNDISQFAPRIETIKVNSEFIGKIIGPGGANIRDIQAQSGAEISIDDDGTVSIYAVNKTATDKARQMISNLIMVPQVGKGYDGLVKSVRDFGAFVEFIPGTQGLIHISELSDDYVKDINTVVKLDDELRVVVSAIDKQGRVKLMREDKYLRQKDEDNKTE